MKSSEYHQGELPPELKSKIISSLKSKQMLSTFTVPKLTLLLSFLVIVGVFSAGYWMHTLFQKDAQSTMDRYMLILKNTPEYKEDLVHVEEYGSWMEKINKMGIVATGDELAAEATFLGSSHTESQDIAALSGYFLIDVPNESQAMTIAKECPHIKHGGQVIVKKVIRH